MGRGIGSHHAISTRKCLQYCILAYLVLMGNYIRCIYEVSSEAAIVVLGNTTLVGPIPRMDDSAEDAGLLGKTPLLAPPAPGSGGDCVGLANFPAHRIDTKRAAAGINNKAQFFNEYLKGKLNITGGRQQTDGGLCLVRGYSSSPADSRKGGGGGLITARDLSSAGYDFAIFIGDSLAREAAWSFRRHVTGDPNAQCQPWPANHTSAENTKDNPSFACADPCGGGDVRPLELNVLPESCCSTPFVLFRDNASLRNLTGYVSDLNRKCPCRGIVYISSATRILVWGTWRNHYGSLEGRGKFSFDTLTSLAADNFRGHKFVWASPPSADLTLMGLKPEKSDHRVFVGVNKSFGLWRDLDADAISKVNDPNVIYSEQFEVSSAYAGLSCDGLHFGSGRDRAMFGCQGMPVVTDVLTQLWLHRVLNPEYPPLSICGKAQNNRTQHR